MLNSFIVFFLSSDNPCELRCIPLVQRGRSRIRKFIQAGDGTPCNHGTMNICIRGKCEVRCFPSLPFPSLPFPSLPSLTRTLFHIIHSTLVVTTSFTQAPEKTDVVCVVEMAAHVIQFKKNFIHQKEKVSSYIMNCFSIFF